MVIGIAVNTGFPAITSAYPSATGTIGTVTIVSCGYVTASTITLGAIFVALKYGEYRVCLSPLFSRGKTPSIPEFLDNIE